MFMINVFSFVSLLLLVLVFVASFPVVSVGMLLLCDELMPGVELRGLLNCVLSAEVVVVCCLGKRYVAERVT